jgi:hypothetical protein
MPSFHPSSARQTFSRIGPPIDAGSASRILIANAKAPQYPEAINFILRQNPNLKSAVNEGKFGLTIRDFGLNL